jgi:hypothetical protein
VPSPCPCCTRPPTSCIATSATAWPCMCTAKAGRGGQPAQCART